MIAESTDSAIFFTKKTNMRSIPIDLVGKEWYNMSRIVFSENFMKEYYFDNAATTPLDKDVFAEMMPFFTTNYGNPSSIYKTGRVSRAAVEKAREKVALSINAKAEEIYFTSGGTESDNTAIRGIAYAYRQKGNHIITTKIEHPAVLETCKQLEKEGFRVTYVGVNESGVVNIDEIKAAITKETVLITVMFVNNELGTIEPVKEIGALAKENNIIFHTDAVQAVGALKIDVQEFNIDSLSISAHKFYGPMGIGALYVKKGVKFNKLITGGHQENGKRAGTENVPAIVGLGSAIEIAYRNFDDNRLKIAALRDYYESQIKKNIPYITINGENAERVAGTSNISFRFIEGEGILLNLDAAGICASSGSACTSGSLDPSHVLLAIGLPHEIAHGSIRVSFGKDTEKADIDYLVLNLTKTVENLRAMSPLYDKFIKEGN